MYKIYTCAKQYLCMTTLATKKFDFLELKSWILSECQATVMLMQTIIPKGLSKSKMHVRIIIIIHR